MTSRRSAPSCTPRSRPKGGGARSAGVDEVVGWAKPNDDGHLISRVEVDELREVGERHVAADARRQWRWKEDDELAAEDRFGALFEFRDGAIVGWRQDFASIIDAIDAIKRLSRTANLRAWPRHLRRRP